MASAGRAAAGPSAAAAASVSAGPDAGVRGAPREWSAFWRRRYAADAGARPRVFHERPNAPRPRTVRRTSRSAATANPAAGRPRRSARAPPRRAAQRREGAAGRLPQRPEQLGLVALAEGQDETVVEEARAVGHLPQALRERDALETGLACLGRRVEGHPATGRAAPHLDPRVDVLAAHEHVLSERAELAAEKAGHEPGGDADLPEEERHRGRERLTVALSGGSGRNPRRRSRRAA